MDNKRVFLIVLDSLGIGHAPDADKFNDEGSDTMGSICKSPKFRGTNMKKLGMFNIDGTDYMEPEEKPVGSYARLLEKSMGKDTTIGHWEMAGIVSPRELPTYPDGFPDEVIDEYKRLTGRDVICNKPYSGTELLRDYGEEHMKTGALMVYTSADSVFQVAANEEVVPLSELYRYCQIARDMLKGEHAVGRVIARPFLGDNKDNFKRTTNRHDYSLLPPAKTMLDFISEKELDTIGVGKIYDIFAGQGVSEQIKTKGNINGMEVTMELAGRDFNGLAFINLVDGDMIYGHRNDVDGYANAMAEFDDQLGQLLPMLRENDMLIITGDHGCDPGTPSTDHSRETVPMLVYGRNIKEGVNLGTRTTFADIAATITDYLGVEATISGESFLSKILK